MSNPVRPYHLQCRQRSENKGERSSQVATEDCSRDCEREETAGEGRREEESAAGWFFYISCYDFPVMFVICMVED
jgi:hypothetical protein